MMPSYAQRSGTTAQRSPELALEARREFVRAEAVVLGTWLGDLQRAHQRRDPSGDRPIETLQQSVQQSGAIRIPATGGIDNHDRLRRRNFVRGAVRVDHRTV